MLAIGVCGASAIVILGIAGFLLFGNRGTQSPAKQAAATDITKPDKTTTKEITKTKTTIDKPADSPTTPSVVIGKYPHRLRQTRHLLKLIDLKRDEATPGWQFDGDAIVVPTANYARLQIPVHATAGIRRRDDRLSELAEAIRSILAWCCRQAAPGANRTEQMTRADWV